MAVGKPCGPRTSTKQLAYCEKTIGVYTKGGGSTAPPPCTSTTHIVQFYVVQDSMRSNHMFLLTTKHTKRQLGVVCLLLFSRFNTVINITSTKIVYKHCIHNSGWVSLGVSLYTNPHLSHLHECRSPFSYNQPACTINLLSLRHTSSCTPPHTPPPPHNS